MNNKTENKKVSRWAVIAISYMVCFAVLFITSQIVSDVVYVKVVVISSLIFCVLALPFAYKTVTKLYDSIFGGLSPFGPLTMFLGIFGIKLLAGFLIALIGGPFIAPYTVGNFIAKMMGAE